MSCTRVSTSSVHHSKLQPLAVKAIIESFYNMNQQRKVDFHEPENGGSNHSILNFDDDDVENEPEVQSQNHIHSQKNFDTFSRKSNRHDSKSRLDFINSQRDRLQVRQGDSPIRRNPNKSQQDLDFSQFGDNDEPQQQEFSYKIERSQVSLSRLEFDEDREQPEKKEYNSYRQSREIFTGLQRVLDHDDLQLQKDKKDNKGSIDCLEDVVDFNDDPPQLVQQHSTLKQVKFEQPIAQNSSLKKLPSQQATQQVNQIAPQLKLTPITMKNIKINDIKNWLHTPVPQGYLMQLCIVRDNSGMARFYPKYHLHLSENQQYLMTAKKLAMQKTSKYLLTYDPNELSRKSSKYLGIIRSNFLGTEFMVYDPGQNPKETQEMEDLRQQIMMVTFDNNVLQTRTPRKMRVILPGIVDGRALVYKPLNSREGIVLESTFPQNRNVTYFEFLNKLPIWNAQINGFILYFNERVNRPSVKNFQLFQVDEKGYPMYGGDTILQFGRHKKQGFNLDVQWPFTPLQAFSMCVANFDYKLACE